MYASLKWVYLGAKTSIGKVQKLQQCNLSTAGQISKCKYVYKCDWHIILTPMPVFPNCSSARKKKIDEGHFAPMHAIVSWLVNNNKELTCK